MSTLFPERIPNWIAGRAECSALFFDKRSPVNGAVICHVSRSQSDTVARAVESALQAQPAWAQTPAVKRGDMLFGLCDLLAANKQTMAKLVAAETGKSVKDAMGETDAAIALGRFMAGEGQRLYGKTTTSAVAGRTVMTVRQPVGVAGLIIAANTPVANIAWKFFPALICGNTVVVKAAEDTPLSAWFFGDCCSRVGIPAGAWQIVQGIGHEAGAALVDDSRVDLISFTGSSAVGRRIAAVAGERLARLSMELGGKNPLLVCDDADLEQAVRWSVLSAFSNAGQRCAAASRIIVMPAVYDLFKEKFLSATAKLKLGPDDGHDLGPVINARQLQTMLMAVAAARDEGAVVLSGGQRAGGVLGKGFFMQPTVLENVSPQSAISKTELFGPVVCLYKADDYEHALELANDCPYGLTASIHTRSLQRSMLFTQRIKAGVASVNGGTHGSEPHMPFGGFKQSGNGSREPGSEALDVYTELKNIVININV